MTTQTEALKLALEALESCDEGDWSTGHVIHPSYDEDAVKQAMIAIEEALAQPEQEPVAWMYPDALCDRACLYLCTKGFTQFPECATTPPQRTWEGLTHSDIDQGLLRSNYAMKTAQAWRDGVYWAQTKLKEKNT